MQLSRLLFLTPEKTYKRKINEMILAMQIEKNYTKEEIFTLYCNQVYFGHGNYGVEAASEFFFSKPIKALSLDEAALLAGLPQNARRLSPIENPERAKDRRNHVLDRMFEERYIGAKELADAKARPVVLRVHKDPPTIAPYFLEEVRKYLEREYGSQRIYQGGLRVETTLDPELQKDANEALRNGLRTLDKRSRGFVASTESVLQDGLLPEPLHLDEWDWPMAAGDVVHGVVVASDRTMALVQIGDYRARVTARDMEWTRRTNVADVLPRGAVAPFAIQSLGEVNGRKEARLILEQEPKVEGALVAMDVKSGAIRAMVGGYDFERSKFNRATQAMRQVGSAFKPIIYSAAIEKMAWTPATIIVDSPISFPNPWNKTVWSPKNYDGEYWGPIPLRRALEHSRNVPAVKTLQAEGVETGIEYARKLGITGELPPFLPIALGAGEATPLEMVAAYADLREPGAAHEAHDDHPDHRSRRQRDRGGPPRGEGCDPRRHGLFDDQPAAGSGGARHRRPGALPETTRRRKDGNDQRLHRRVVHRLRARPRRRRVGRLRRQDGSASAVARRGRARPSPSGWTSGPPP